jgi:hypothetical protein
MLANAAIILAIATPNEQSGYDAVLGAQDTSVSSVPRR